MATTGAPWNIPYVEPTDIPRTYPDDSEDLALAVAAGLTAAGNAFDAVAFITATNASWPVPSLASPIVKVTAIGGGGGGGTGAQTGTGGATGGTTTFDAGGALVVTATGGAGGQPAQSATAPFGPAGNEGFASQNGGGGAPNVVLNNSYGSGKNGLGGKVVSAYLDLTGITTVNVTIAAGGAAGTPDANGRAAGAGGRGEVIVEYKAA